MNKRALLKRFLWESPVLWALVALVIAIGLTVFCLLIEDWSQAGLLGILTAWILVCIRKDYIIWTLTKK